MDTFFRRVVVEPLKSLLDKLLDFLPNFFSFILIFVSGVIVGLILRSVLLRFFRIIGLDAFSERSGLIAALQKGGIREPISLVLAKLISWLVIAGFSIFALNALKLPAVEQVLESFILYLPNIFVGTIIFLFGYLLSNFLSRAVLIAGVNAGIRIAGVIAKLVRLTVFCPCRHHGAGATRDRAGHDRHSLCHHPGRRCPRPGNRLWARGAGHRPGVSRAEIKGRGRQG